ncbi:hypothetical protein TraAM80_04614 [Trypanosoma rangeli]|uniref:Uncharacterized protein n=1 Tax=Trypanosoma rangeli TaxID=5698 RepID=A0A3R7NNW0_TRYRA|nr:uncharacterized protein TraAM80_04614 [Trypanosoma rangeli]RNF05404.1 hypothetical protein TraAM80_04614 [Trypanosoma rangeli]|eukprot:RNF05404.1 hypothetical protein TraAM80_04614 [Trypanosoma rangeli]
MDAASLIREEIARLREEIDRSSCYTDEKLFGDARAALMDSLDNDYGGSYFYYFLYCFIVPLVMVFIVLLLYYCVKMMNEWKVLRCLLQQMRDHPLIIKELHTRELSQASRRSARRRTSFVIILKCLIATSVLMVFIGSRVMMEAMTRGWLKNLLVSPSSATGGAAAAAAAGGSIDPWFELYTELMMLLSVDWFRDVQGLFVFSFFGSSMMMIGLRLLRSASEDVASMRTDSISSLQLLQKIDDKYMERGQELVQKQMEGLIAMLAEYALPQLAAAREAVAAAAAASKDDDGEKPLELTGKNESFPKKDEIEASGTEDNNGKMN